MIETNTQPSKAGVRDPVCGMTIDPTWAFATRQQLGSETVYFCSEHSVQQFDRGHARSATTGVTNDRALRRIDWRRAHVPVLWASLVIQ